MGLCERRVGTGPVYIMTLVSLSIHSSPSKENTLQPEKALCSYSWRDYYPADKLDAFIQPRVPHELLLFVFVQFPHFDE